MLKRDLYLFVRCLLAASVLTAVFAAVSIGAAIAGMRGAEKVYTPVKAAVVDGEDSVLSRILIRAVAGTDHIANLLEIERCDADKAYNGLALGEFAAVIELPENFVHDILTGAQKRGRITLSSAAAVHGDIVESVAAYGELLLAAGQYAIFCGETVMDRYESDAQFREQFLAETNALLLTEAMASNSRYFVLSVTDYADTGMSLAAHYAASWLAALLMLGTVMFERLYTADRSRSMLLRLHTVGVSDGAFILWKFLLPFGFLVAVLLLALFALGRWIEVEWGILAAVCALLGAACVAATGAALGMCLDRGAPAFMVSTLVGLFLCGGLVPRRMLGQWLLLAGDLTPLGISRGLLAPIFGGELMPVTVIAALVWLVGCPVVIVWRLRVLRQKGGAL
ncbi:MAG: ABC transporter permease [Oscillospiraceae bacterium]|nr:ABC transporter permease [Oscillospiraceae bacterium]